jgi:hypothetical protein
MADPKKNLDESTQVVSETAQQRRERLIQDAIEDAKRRESQFDLDREIQKNPDAFERVRSGYETNKLKFAQKPDSIYYGKSLETFSPEQKKIEMDRIKAESLAEARKEFEQVAQKNPEMIEFWKEEARKPLEVISKEDALKKLRGTEDTKLNMKSSDHPLFHETPDEVARDVDIGKIKNQIAREKQFSNLKSSMGRGTQKVLGALPKVATGLGAVGAAMDVKEGNIPEVGLDIAETGLGMAGKLAGRAAPFLELLRPTSTQTQEQEEAELAKYRRLNNMLTEQKKKNRMPASEE